MIAIGRTYSGNKDFQYLIHKRDIGLAEGNENKNNFLVQFSKISMRRISNP
ncbi:hypothetical protein BD94_0672 [Elizabethkingia anophelis NUHP1]|uniref:Uncharacterized protein n=1 Tax=Elizabethkingia anophelis NUHP1 TaxID=1338011 RepID=A0A077EAD3_9FLAO|nr:hypothetical protein BD94_0672 [Elizabethkingia anophelis NUHP1]CAH1143361.1 hypothetical protein EAVNVH72_00335 [Elizabethkingia anophelis]CAI9683864.1 hypothetical protein EAVNVH72_02502 [Elizabethkingia anophelis]